ncbi:sphingosine-1-phosphate phosphatase 2 isoform X2 [Paroedura picta]|uniref:sphingosine-1-phosphate phosphatase 2 isoform X2 n=1 Tax=Paroedura picta TaxID=143630 RepID=UPI00405684F5
MAWLVRSLWDSEPVARFQRRCGLFPAASEAGDAAARRGAGAGSHLPGTWDVRNGGGDGAALAGHSPRPPAACATGTGGKDHPHEYVVKNYFYYYLFRISAAMGQEVFFITFLPFTYWNISPYVARRLIIMWSYPFELGLLGAFAFSTLVGLSRIYTGMHTVLDVIVGSLISGVLVALMYPTWDFLDHWMLTNPWCPIFCIVVPLLLCYNYPKLDNYSPTRADTTIILGASAGTVIGFWLNNNYIVNYSAEIVSPPSVTVLMALARFLVGFCFLVVTRQIIKSMALRALCSWYKVPVDDPIARHQIEIEVPYMFMTYCSIGLSATVLVPLLHEVLSLN